MIVSFKDCLKFIGVSVVCFCAVFVCTFFLNYYIDVIKLKDFVSVELLPLYNAQLATAKMTTAITSGFLSLIAVIMLFFYIKIYIDANYKMISILKAMGYSNLKVATNFLVFGVSVFTGTFIGFATGWLFMPMIYEGLTIEGLPVITPKFHVWILLLLVILPSIVFTLFVFLYSVIRLKSHTPLYANTKYKEKIKTNKNSSISNRPFLREMCFSVLKSKKILAFFITFSCFCFSAMVQMGLSMEDLVDGTMGILILIIGLVLASVSMFMSMTDLIKYNSKNIAVMKSMGFNKMECFISIFFCYIPLAVLGFIIGTIYQFGLLSIMVNLIFKDVGKIPVYSFNVPVLFITFIAFIILYSLTFAFYFHKANKISINEIMLEY